MDHRLPATPDMARAFSELFVNRRAYAIQSMRPHAESGRHYYYRPYYYGWYRPYYYGPRISVCAGGAGHHGFASFCF